MKKFLVLKSFRSDSILRRQMPKGGQLWQPKPFRAEILNCRYSEIWGDVQYQPLAQKLVLTLLNNEFILKILISTPFGRKIRERFRLKNHKSQISG